MIDKQIKERRRINNEISRIKQAILNVRVEANILVADLGINTKECVEMANLMSNSYDLLDEGQSTMFLITRDRL